MNYTPENKMQYGSCCRVEFVSNSYFKHAVMDIVCHPSTKFCAISQSSSTQLSCRNMMGFKMAGMLDCRIPQSLLSHNVVLGC